MYSHILYIFFLHMEIIKEKVIVKFVESLSKRIALPPAVIGLGWSGFWTPLPSCGIPYAKKKNTTKSTYWI